MRKVFIPDEGCVFASSDYSQIELRIMAHLSADKNMVEAFMHDQDIHAATASKIYHVPIEEVTADMRRKAKTANFGIIYGFTPIRIVRTAFDFALGSKTADRRIFRNLSRR
jgi:DNA polymerase-1